MTIQEQIDLIQQWAKDDEWPDAYSPDFMQNSLIEIRRSMEKLNAVYEAAQKVEPLLRGDPLIDGPVQWQEDIDLRRAIEAVKDS